jgi:hypothetical protein
MFPKIDNGWGECGLEEMIEPKAKMFPKEKMSWGKDVLPWRRRVEEKFFPHEEDKTKEQMWPEGQNGPKDSSLGKKWC